MDVPAEVTTAGGVLDQLRVQTAPAAEVLELGVVPRQPRLERGQRLEEAQEQSREVGWELRRARKVVRVEDVRRLLVARDPGLEAVAVLERIRLVERGCPRRPLEDPLAQRDEL